VILSLQLPFAIVPLVMFCRRPPQDGELIAPRWVTHARSPSPRHHRVEPRFIDFAKGGGYS
jgi:hypothetical protein